MRRCGRSSPSWGVTGTLEPAERKAGGPRWWHRSRFRAGRRFHPPGPSRGGAFWRAARERKAHTVKDFRNRLFRAGRALSEPSPRSDPPDRSSGRPERRPEFGPTGAARADICRRACPGRPGRCPGRAVRKPRLRLAPLIPDWLYLRSYCVSAWNTFWTPKAWRMTKGSARLATARDELPGSNSPGCGCAINPTAI
jgi:hypothetical protein